MSSCNMFITTAQAAEQLGVSTSWLEKLRVSGFGPPYFKPSERRVFYRIEDLDVWMNSHRKTSTSDVSKGGGQ